MRRARMETLVLVAFASLGTGCGDELPPTSLIDKARPLGARIAVEGDEDRSTPAPGETAVVDWILEQPSGTPVLASWAFIGCEPIQTTFGIGVCGGDPFFVDAVPEPTMEAPRQRVTVPADYAGDEVLLLGVLCLDGAVTVDPTADLSDPEILESLCSEGARPIPTTLSIDVEQSSEDRNRRPRYGPATIDGAAWEADAPPTATTCERLELPTYVVGGDVAQIEITATEGSRESFTVVFGDPPVPMMRTEELQNSLFTTAGELQFSFVFIEDETLTERFEWSPPTSGDIEDQGLMLGPEGLLVRFVFVMRDLRGGLDLIRRAACVREAPAG